VFVLFCGCYLLHRVVLIVVLFVSLSVPAMYL
jgi:hypothetical protein